MCAGCRGRAPAGDLLRLAWDAVAGVVVDDRRRLPGRGVWLHPECGERAVRTRAIARGLGRDVAGDQVRAALEGRAPVG